MKQAFSSESAEQTQGFGRALAALLQPQDVVLLNGTLGSGKTEFARGVIAALCGEVEVTSPTFNLVQTYPAELEGLALEIWHVDLYRLNDAQQLAELGLFDPYETRITLVEWPEILGQPAGDEVLAIDFETSDDGRRLLTFTGSKRWQACETLALQTT